MIMMNINRVEHWLDIMQKLGEADSPMYVEGIIFTPRELAQYLISDDPSFRKTASTIIRHKNYKGNELSNLEYRDILKQRINIRYKNGRLPTIRMMGFPNTLTPEQQLEEIEKESTMGLDLLENEKKLMEELLRRL